MKKEKAVLDMVCEIGAVSFPAAPARLVNVTFTFGADEDLLSRIAHARKNHLVRLADIDRGNGKVKDFGDIDGQIKSVSLPTKIDRPGRFVVAFPETKGLYDALRYMRKCDPCTCAIFETQIEIPDPSEDGAGADGDDDDQLEMPEE